MHEFGIASMLVDNIKLQAAKHGAKKVLQVEVEIGEFAFVNFDQIEFCYDSIVQGSILEGSKLILSLKKGTVHCENCDYRGDVATLDDEDATLYGVMVFMCPECSQYTKIIDGQDFTIKRLKLSS